MTFALILVTACSSNFFYNRLDYLVPWYVDGYVDLSSAQRTQLKSDLGPILRWHRAEELAQYSQFISDVETELDADVCVETMQRWVDFSLESYGRVLARSQSMLLDLTADLSAAQVGQLIDKLREEQREDQKEFLQRTRVEYDKANYENMEEGLEDWLGRLDRTQRAGLQSAIAKLVRYDQLWLDDRQLWVDKIAGVLSARAPGWREALETAMNLRGDYSGRSYREVSERNQAILSEAVVAVLNSRSTAQDKKLRKKLKEWRVRFEKLQST
ncbi:MAG: hypothetical protein ACI9GW_001013 [Halieaceae bacterium]|jgi:hypothetical protein